MKIIGNTLIGIGMLALIIGTMIVDSVQMPLSDKQFLFQIACLIGGLGTAFIGVLVRIMDE